MVYRMLEGGPEMLGGVGTPGPPTRAVLDQCPFLRRQAQLLGGQLEAEVAGREMRRGRRSRAWRSSPRSRGRLRAGPAIAAGRESSRIRRRETTLPSAIPPTSALNVRCRAFGTARWIGSISASCSTDGKVCVNPPMASCTGCPYAATSRPAWVRAALVDTCWPRTARTASSASSTVRGMRCPGALTTTGPRSGSALSASTTASGSASRSSRRRHRAIAVARSRKSSSTSRQRT